MNELTFIHHGDVFTNTWIIAQSVGYAHKDIVKHTRTYRKRFNQMGGTYYAPSVKSGGGRDIRPIALNETQAIFMMTLLDNDNERILDFKQALSIEFVSMRRLLLEKQTASWQAARLESKDFRRMLTDTIKELIPYAIEQGSTHPDELYRAYAKMIKRLSGYDDLDLTDRETLTTVSMMLRTVQGVLIREMAVETYYKDIFQKAKGQLIALMALWNAPKLIA